MNDVPPSRLSHALTLPEVGLTGFRPTTDKSGRPVVEVKHYVDGFSRTTIQPVSPEALSGNFIATVVGPDSLRLSTLQLDGAMYLLQPPSFILWCAERRNCVTHQAR
jgi:hypothetical protein